MHLQYRMSAWLQDLHQRLFSRRAGVRKMDFGAEPRLGFGRTDFGKRGEAIKGGGNWRMERNQSHVWKKGNREWTAKENSLVLMGWRYWKGWETWFKGWQLRGNTERDSRKEKLRNKQIWKQVMLDGVQVEWAFLLVSERPELGCRMQD